MKLIVKAEMHIDSTERKHSADLEDLNYQISDLNAENMSLQSFLQFKGLTAEWKKWKDDSSY